MFSPRCRACGTSNEKYLEVAKEFICRSCAMGIFWFVQERGDQQQMIELGFVTGKIGVADKALEAIPRDDALQACVLPLDIHGGKLTVMTGADTDSQELDALAAKRGVKIVRVDTRARSDELRRVILQAYGSTGPT